MQTFDVRAPGICLSPHGTQCPAHEYSVAVKADVTVIPIVGRSYDAKL